MQDLKLLLIDIFELTVGSLSKSSKSTWNNLLVILNTNLVRVNAILVGEAACLATMSV